MTAIRVALENASEIREKNYNTHRLFDSCKHNKQYETGLKYNHEGHQRRGIQNNTEANY